MRVKRSDWFGRMTRCSAVLRDLLLADSLPSAPGMTQLTHALMFADFFRSGWFIASATISCLRPGSVQYLFDGCFGELILFLRDG